MTLLLIVAGWIAAGVVVAFAAKHERWIENVRCWHVVFWPLLLLGWLVVLTMFWMAQSRR